MIRRISTGFAVGLFGSIVGVALFGKVELYYFLAPTQRIDAPVLVIEGWLSPESLRQAVEEIKTVNYQRVLVTSIAHGPVFRMYSRGGLRFYLSDIDSINRYRFQDIKIRAFGSEALGVQAHAKIMLDSVQVGEFTATDKLEWHAIALPQATTADSITLIFDNDRRAGREDRDLFVDAIQLGSREVPARHFAVRYDRGKLDGNNVLRTDYASIAEEAAEFLINEGVDSTILTTLSAPAVEYERTYASALMVKKYLSNTAPAIVVFSDGPHSRRSRLVYQRVLDNSVKVGIVAAKSNSRQPQNWWEERASRNYVLLQFAKYLYTKVLFFPEVKELV